jgi:hypothetical protein
VQSPFGPQVNWVDVEQLRSQAPQQPGAPNK